MTRAMVLTQVGPAGPSYEAFARKLVLSAATSLASSVELYRSVEGPRSYAMVETFESAAGVSYAAAAELAESGGSFARHLCIEIADDVKSNVAAQFLMIVAFCVPAERRAEVDEWYELEHAPLLLKAQGWLRARRHHGIASVGDARWTHVALHDLSDLETLDSAERAFARSTEWRARLTRESWFERAGRWIYERIAPESL